MALTWGQICKYFRDGTGNPTQAGQEQYDHVTEGLRRVCSSVEIPQIYATADYTVASGADSVALLSDVHHVTDIFNKTNGIPCREEPDGIGGRTRKLEVTTGKPPVGEIAFWWRDGANLLVRGTAPENTTLSIRYMLQVSPITDADLNENPVTPAQYDFAIVHFAVASYLSLHPADNTVIDPERNLTRLQAALASAQASIRGPKEVYREENKGRRENMRMPGYQFSPRVRLGRRGW